MKVCPECGNEFKPKHFNDKLCGPDCKALWAKRKHREASALARQRRPRPLAKSMQPRPCEICGDIFKPNSPNQRACSKVECRRGVGGAMTVDSEVACVICGTKFLAKAGSYRKTCADPACEFALNSQTQKANREKEKSAPKPPPDYGMPCPWATPGKLGSGPEGVSWYSAQADPMTRGIWVTGNLETVRARSVAA